MADLNIDASEVKKKMDKKEKFILLDVRTQWERDIVKLDDDKIIPIQELEERYKELDKKKEIICYCHHGNRSLIAAQFLHEKGFKAKSMNGGIEYWAYAIDKNMRRY
ncbi:MAG TPA: rhodanese-like domain-containing protein [Candidatus Nanoarchaeia archaeon]|nr:rhodanese-like domain-containing protein [Candidatus Nanoarchaeia archaeon]